MLDCAATYSLFRDQGLNFFTGVPDSLLKDFCAYVSDHASSDDHVIAANEGNAVALAIGHFLGTGDPAVVYLQNSGTGNVVNPLLSLADPDVYSIPVLLVIGWRGEPGVEDEPQHVKQGRRMTELLDAMEMPWYLLPRDITEAGEVIAEAVEAMRQCMGPVAILVRKKTFEPYKLSSELATCYSMSREEAIQCIVRQLGSNDIVVSTTGKTSRELYEYRVEQGSECHDFLTVGGMGHTSSIAMGLARAQPDRLVACIDGDGSLIMHMGSLGVIGKSAGPNLLHIVINNGAHDSVGGQPTVGYDIDIPAIAAACGYRTALSVGEVGALEAAIATLREEAGPSLLEVKVNKGARADLGRPKSTPVENRDALMKHVGH